MTRGILIGAALLAAAATASADDLKKYPRLHAALHELREARDDVKASKFSAKKKAPALDAINDALASLKLALAVKGDDFKGIDRDKDRLKKFKDHPRIRAAIEDLRDARKFLDEAPDKFNGHKKRAITDIDRAIAALRVLIN